MYPFVVTGAVSDPYIFFPYSNNMEKKSFCEVFWVCLSELKTKGIWGMALSEMPLEFDENAWTFYLTQGDTDLSPKNIK